MDRAVTTVIDQELCNGCGLCVDVCPADTITLKGEKAVITGDQSLGCGHCAAACPTGAIRVKAIEPSQTAFTTFEKRGRWLPFGKPDISDLANLMESRRSCRNYQEKPIDRQLLEDLVKIGTTAPSGTNAQMWTFTIFPARENVVVFADKIAGFFRKLNKVAEKKWVRLFLKTLGKPELEHYYREYYETVKERLQQHESAGRDSLFHGASAAIIVSSKKEASCPAEDALLATQNILLAAHSVGLGTCLIGFAVSAMNKDRKIAEFLNIPDDETPYSVIALGYPAEQYLYVAGRKKAVVRYFGAE
jgi:nitroreductase/NAD-dependent dihydropyrimidine dehydrogenase PreA subunit